MRMMMQGMMKLMEGMQVLQSQIVDAKKSKDMEIVKGAIPDLPRLPEWKAETAPLDLTDWLLTIEPAMGDLSDTSQQWWEQMLQSARSWYIQHQEKSPWRRSSTNRRFQKTCNIPGTKDLRSESLLFS